MNIETLKQYAHLIGDINEIQREITAAYKPVSSPNGNEVIGAPGTHNSDPTAQAVALVTELKQTMAENIKRSLDLRIEIEHWLTSVERSEIRQIVRVHYINGPNMTGSHKRVWTWADTCLQVYGFKDNRYARRKLTDYLKQEVKEDEGELDTNGCETAD